MSYRLPGLALLAGNFVIGLSILAPAGMIEPLAADLGVTVVMAGYLVTGGAVALCIGSPLVAWAASTTDRRPLLSIALAAICLTHIASALSDTYTALLAIRLVAMGFAAVFTPQAASAIALIANDRDRPGAISFVFLGWSLAAAAGLPLVAWASAELGWRSIHVALALVAAVSALSVYLTVPSGLRGAPMSFAAWRTLLRSRLVVSLLAATVLAAAGQFAVFTYFGPLLARTAGASATDIAVCFAVFGIAGFVGNVVATRIVGRIGAFNTSMLFFSSMAVGAVLWTLGGSSLLAAGVASAVWGFGFAASNSMQQARLAAAAPAMAGAAIALNSTSIFAGQATGSATGGALFEAGCYTGMGWTAAAFLAVTLLVILSTRRLTGLSRGD